jgi:preprotein translocase subunit SecB
MSEEPKRLRLYPIQATHIGVRELYIKANEAPDDAVGLDESDYELFVGHSDYDAEEKSITIAIRIEAGRRSEESETEEEDEEQKERPPFHLRVRMIGVFTVDDSLFPADRIYEWAKRNSLYIMYPYLREHVYALSSRAGFSPMLLPLVEVPLFRIAAPEPSETESRTNEVQPQV